MTKVLVYGFCFSLLALAIILVIASHYFWALGCIVLAGTFEAPGKSDTQRLKK